MQSPAFSSHYLAAKIANHSTSNSSKKSHFTTMSEKITLENPPTSVVNFNWDEPSSTFKLEKHTPTEDDVPEGHVLVSVQYLSNDPTQRTWIRADQDPKRSYHPPVQKGAIVESLGLGEVIASKSSKYSKGDVVVGLLGWAKQIVVHEQAIANKVDTSLGLPLPLYLASLGMTGLTAFFGLTEVGHIKEGQTVLISAASGATGSMAVQLAKHVFKASKVFGIAGSDDKCKWVESIGADYCANYKEEGWKKKLSEKIGPDFVDIYFDNVGGEILDFSLSHVKGWGRVIACGAIAGYNDTSKARVNNWFQVISNRLTVQGFIVFDFKDKIPQAVQAISGALKEGKIKSTEGVSLEDLSDKPFTDVPKVWNRLFTDEKPLGKLVTKIA